MAARPLTPVSVTGVRTEVRSAPRRASKNHCWRGPAWSAEPGKGLPQCRERPVEAGLLRGDRGRNRRRRYGRHRSGRLFPRVGGSKQAIRPRRIIVRSEHRHSALLVHDHAGQLFLGERLVRGLNVPRVGVGEWTPLGASDLVDQEPSPHGGLCPWRSIGGVRARLAMTFLLLAYLRAAGGGNEDKVPPAHNIAVRSTPGGARRIDERLPFTSKRSVRTYLSPHFASGRYARFGSLGMTATLEKQTVSAPRRLN